jgi:amidase
MTSPATAATIQDTTGLAGLGAAEQARLVRAGEASAREVLDDTLARIDRLDPLLNAFRVVRAERARTEAEAAPPGPLAGVPVAIKDDTDVAGELTCYGTAASDREAGADHPVVARLRAAGAVIVGKTHVPEVDAWGFTESLAFGATRNPWDTGRTCGGSSGGSAVAAATGMCGVAHGTDGTGSLRNPAAWCGILGFKPGRGLLPGSAAISGWHGMVVNGAMGRTAADVAAFLEAAAGAGFVEAAASPPPRLRIALTLKPPPGMGGSLDEPREAAVHRAAEVLRGLGHTVVERDPELPRTTGLAIDAKYFHGIAEDVRHLPHPDRLERRTRRVGRLGRALSPILARADAIAAEAAAGLDRVHQEADVLLFPGSVQGPWPVGRFRDSGALVTGYLDTSRVAFQPLWNLVGRPAAMVPWGLDEHGLPVAVQLGARAGDERLLLSLVAELQEAEPPPVWPPA